MSSEELNPSSTDDTLIIRSLEASLKANGIQVADGVVQEFLDKREWIYRSKGVEDLLQKLSPEQLYSVFNYQHQLNAFTKLLETLPNRRQKVSVVYGHQAQGKTQFLFFVFKLLQAMGEKVLYLDKPMLPSEESDGKIDIDSDKFCGHLWKDSFLQLGGDVKTYLDQLFKDASPRSFGYFKGALQDFVYSTKTRIWIIVDDVVLFEDLKFPIQFPHEQDPEIFHWIVTGGIGIDSWVGRRHLEKLVFDLPLFTKDECVHFATRLCTALNINLENALAVPSAGIDDWLEEYFGGVFGYIAEMLLEISNGKTASQYMMELSRRIKKVINDSAKRSHISTEAHAKDWLNEIQSNENRWYCLLDAGLCGNSSPRGVMFTQILKWLFIYNPQVDELQLARLFQADSLGDPGSNGCLLELEEILKLKASHSMETALLTLTDQGWNVKKSISLPPTGGSLNIMMYEEDQSRLEVIQKSPSSSLWYLIQVPTGFDVIDVVLVDTTTGSSAIYGIQITQSLKPFSRHHTFDTCAPNSAERLDKFWRAISNHFKLDDTVKKFYVMRAPKSEGDEFKPPAGHSSDFYVSPTSVITGYADPSNVKRHAIDPVSAHPPSFVS